MKKIAVFTTSDIQEIFKSKDWKFLFRMHDYDFYSTGKFEKAISEGYEIYVISTRSELGDHDKWWSSQIPAENISVGTYRGGGANDKHYIQIWRDFYLRMGCDPDTIQFHKLTCFNKDEMKYWEYYTSCKPSWMDYYEALHKIGIVRGWDF